MTKTSSRPNRQPSEPGTWAVEFHDEFDPERRAIVLVAGDKQGTTQSRFYKKLIAKADERFDSHLKRITGAKAGR